MNTLFMRTQIIVLMCVVVLLVPVFAVFADHGDEETVEIHAVSVHGHNENGEAVVLTATPAQGQTIDIAKIQKMQQLLRALTQLVALLEMQKGMLHDTTLHDLN